MSDIANFRKLIKAAYPGLNASVSIELVEDGHRVGVEVYKVRLTGQILHSNCVEAQGHSPGAALNACKKPVAQSRRRKDATGVLRECLTLAAGQLDEGQQEQLLAELLDCHYASYQQVAASCRTRAAAIGQAAREACNQELTHS